MSPLTAFSLFKAEGSLGLLTGNCHVDDARNILVKNFLETDCETLVFLRAFRELLIDKRSWPP